MAHYSVRVSWWPQQGREHSSTSLYSFLTDNVSVYEAFSVPCFLRDDDVK